MTILSWTENYGDKIYQGYDLSILKRDEYYLNVINNSTEKNVNIFSTYEECVEVKTHNLKLSILTNCCSAPTRKFQIQYTITLPYKAPNISNSSELP